MGWEVLTNIGDSAIMGPAILGIAAWLCGMRARHVAVRWLLLAGFAIGAVAVTKIAFMGWGAGIRTLDFTGISGHATLSMAVLPFAGFLIGRNTSPRSRAALVASGCFLALAIAVSRVVLSFHSSSEVIAGCALGGAVALGAAAAARRGLDASLPQAAALAIGLAALIVGTNGHRAPSEGVLAQLAMRLSGHSRAFTRADWAETSTALERQRAAGLLGLPP